MLGMLARPERAPLWGDGFADDSWASVFEVRSFDQLSVDELVRLFPTLVADRSHIAPEIVDLLGGVVVPLERGLSSHARRTGLGAMLHVAANKLQPVWMGTNRQRSKQKVRPTPSIALLRTVLEDLRRGTVPPSDADMRANFAFLSGIHPAYIWPESVVTHERDTAAGWLGVLSRGRPALMTDEVTDYFLDIISGQGSSAFIGDPLIADLAEGLIDASYLERAASSRRRGKNPVVRARRAHTTQMARPSSSMGSKTCDIGAVPRHDGAWGLP